jgi:predicted alpha/beta superfamily hydrolase
MSKQHASAALAVLALTLAAPARAQDAPTPSGAFEIDSKVMSEPRRVIVWTPPGYDTGRMRVPVLYLTDAQAQFAHTVTTVEFLSRNGRIPPMLVVGLFNTDRTRDLTPYKDGTPDNDTRLPTAGGADRFLRFIEAELIPWVESRYRTEPYRVFAGHSFGGLFAVHALATRPGLFHATISVSPTLAWRDGEPSKRMAQMLAGRKDLKAALYLTLGDEGDVMQSGFDRMKAVLDRHAGGGLRWHMVSMRDEDHGSIVLRSHYTGLEKIFEGWRLPLGGARAFTGGLAEVDAHYRGLSERLGWAISPPEVTVNLLGYAAMGRGDLEGALQLFRANVRNHPDSPNVYDSLGEGLERAGKLDDALAQYEEAVKRGEAAGDPLLDAFRQHRDAARRKTAER